jgi:hypothetical protein
MAFQITSPINNTIALLPHALVMHVNPANFNETHTKKVERFQTRGGFVEQHWGDELSEISCDGSTSAFMNLYSGLSSVLRQQTIAWDRYRDLHDLFRNNGDVYDPYGNIVLRGNVMLMYDKGVYVGYFTTFESEETDSSPFTFNLTWAFKVEQIIQQLPNLGQNTNLGTGHAGTMVGAYPMFQTTNTFTPVAQPTVSTLSGPQPVPVNAPPASLAATTRLSARAPTQASSGTIPTAPANTPAPAQNAVATAPPDTSGQQSVALPPEDLSTGQSVQQ